jgi:hypothetical protein
MTICSATALRDSPTSLLRQKHASRLVPLSRLSLELVAVNLSASYECVLLCKSICLRLLEFLTGSEKCCVWVAWPLIPCGHGRLAFGHLWEIARTHTAHRQQARLLHNAFPGSLFLSLPPFHRWGESAIWHTFTSAMVTYLERMRRSTGK